jgi:urea transport system permease protein
MASSILRLARRSIGALGIALITIAPLAAYALTPADIAPLGSDDFDA